MKSDRTTRRSIRSAIFIGVLAGSVFSSSSAFADPTPISLQEELEAIGATPTSLGGSYILTADIDLVAPLSGASTYITGAFTGNLDGNGKTLSGLTKPLFDDIEGDVSSLNLETIASGFDGQGILANETFSGSTIDAVSATGAITTSYGYVGGLVAVSRGSITNSGTSGSIDASSGSYIGGLAGYVDGGSITNSSSEMSVLTTGGNVGGLVGATLGTVGITDSFATGSVIVNSDNQWVGGLVGYSTADIANSYATGDVTVRSGGVGSGGGWVGGLVGENTGTISNSYATGDVISGGDIGGLVGYSSDGAIINSYATGNVTGSGTSVGGLVGENGSTNISNSYSAGNISGGSEVGGLVGHVGSGDISNSYATGLISSTGDYLGGLVGYTNGAISNSFAQTTIESENSEYVGGLVGYTNGAISNSHARVVGNLEAQSYVGGLAGVANGTISNSHANIGGDIIADGDLIGGLAGQVIGSISESYVSIGSDLVGNFFSGGLAGYMQGNILNSAVYIGGNLEGYDYVGGLTGYLDQGNIENSDVRVGGNLSGNAYVGGLSGGFSNILEVTNIDDSDVSIGGTLSGLDRFGGLVGALYGGRTVSSYFSVGGTLGENSDGDLFGYIDPSYSYLTTYTDPEKIWDIKQLSEFPSPLQTINNGLTPGVFGLNSCLNQGIPYLIALSATLTSTCNSGRAPRLTRELGTRETLELRALNKIERISGFKNDTLLPKSAAISFVGPREEIDIAKVKAVEITPTANVKVRTKVGEALQISLKSESKESVELWVKSPDGTWLLAGVITFDKDGKAILPPLQFKGAGDYTLVLNKPSAGSAKGSEPLNQSGSLLVEVI